MEDKSEKKLIWLVFYALAAMGKNEFLGRLMEECKKADINCEIISSDVAQKKAADAVRARDPDMNFEEAKAESKQEAQEMFNQMAIQAVKNIKPGRNIIVIEKVSNGVGYLKNINKYNKVPFYVKTKLVAVIPKEEGCFEYHSESYVVPFSQGLIANSLYRSIERGDHVTMKGSNLKKIFIALSFVKSYDGLRSLKEKKKDVPNISNFLEISFIPPFSAEKEKLIPKEFTHLLKKSLRNMEKAFNGDMDICTELADYVSRPEFEAEFGDIIYQSRWTLTAGSSWDSRRSQ